MLTMCTKNLPPTTAGTSQPEPIRGAKVLVKPDDDRIPLLIDEWTSMGITDVFVKDDLYASSAFRKAIAGHTFRTWLIAQVYFWDRNHLSDHPDFFAITDEGRPAKADPVPGQEEDTVWLEMASPSSIAYEEQTIARIRRQVAEFQPDGISLDFIRYFAFWELVAPDANPASLPDTCFSTDSLTAFSAATGISLPEGQSTQAIADFIHAHHPDEWTRFKCARIADMVSRIAAVVREEKPDIRINLHAVPWRQGDFNGAVRRITGQDMSLLAPLVDMISPMTYARMTGHGPDWIHEVTADIHAAAGQTVPVAPAIQSVEMYKTGAVTDALFEQYLTEAMKAPSSGVIVWPYEQMTESQKEIVKRVFNP